MTIKDYAIKYIKAGIPVFPLHWIKQDGSCSCRLGAMCDAKGKHPRIKNWQEEASTDETKVKEWWQKTPLANIGIPMGERSGFVALDVDTRHGGDKSLEALEEEYGKLPNTVTARTGSGGKHYLFKYTDKLNLKNVVNFRNGLDIRTTGGLIVVSPSMHHSGNRYKWEENKNPIERQAAEMPEWLINEIQKVGKPVANKKISENNKRKTVNEGGRNNYLTSLAGTLRRKGMSEDGILNALKAENKVQCTPPLDDFVVKQIAQSVARYAPETKEKEYALTDSGNAERFADMYKSQVRYCNVFKKWFIWNGKYWAKDDSGKIINYAIESVRSIIHYADLLPDGDKRKELIKHSLKSENAGKLKALLDIASGLDAMSINPDMFDKNLWYLNAENGVINLKSGNLISHNENLYITKMCKVGIDKKCKTPLWDNLLDKITKGEELMKRYLQKAIGCALSGDVSEQAIFILYGKGSNGKSTFLNIIAELLQDYSQNTPSETFMIKKNEAVNNDVARLKGARFVTAIEVEENKRLAESLIKSMTGGDKLTTRFLYGEFFDYKPQFKVFLACNHRPIIRDTTHSIWRRIKLIPFEATISEQERDKYLFDKIVDNELPGILAWAVEGCLLWQKEGLTMPDSITTATEKYRSEMDAFGNFLEEVCVLGEEYKVTNKALRAAYEEWCKDNGEYALYQRAFGDKLREQGIKSTRGGGNGSTTWHGIKIKGEPTPL